MTVYSNSRLSCFEKCPLQFRYRYIDRIRRDTQGIEAFLGNRVHEAIEHLYRVLREGRKPRTAEVVAFYHRKWEENYDPSRIAIVRHGLCAADYLQAGEEYVSGYCDRRRPEEDGETLGLEDEFQLALDPAGRYQIRGFIDRLARVADGVYAVHDYKTSAWLPRDADLRRDRQLTFYQMSVTERYPDAREIRLIWHYLAHGKRLESRRSETDIAAHRTAAMRLIDAIEAAREHPPRESALCRWCEYRDICPAQKHQVSMERQAAERRRKDEDDRRLMAAARPAGRAEQLSLIPAPAAARPRPPAG